MIETIAPFSKPVYILAKPVGAHCNLRCNYCYYLEKGSLYPTENKHLMSEDLLEQFTRQYIEIQSQPEILFSWHGGEPLLRPLSFYEKAINLQRIYGEHRIICNSIQTNGVLLNDDWCKFFHDNGWLVGLSIDGPQEFHDAYRRTVDNRPSFKIVRKAIDLLNKHQVEWNAMAVVNDKNVGHPLEFYRFFRDNECKYLQLSPIVERLRQDRKKTRLAHIGQCEDLALSECSVTSVQWGDFLCKVFDEWVHQDVGKFFVEIFDCTLANWVGGTPGICVYAKECGNAGVMEYNGDVYSCDHFVFPEYLLGNIREMTLPQMLYGMKQSNFSQLKHRSLPKQCQECDFEFACHGECPKNRFIKDKYGHPGLNYLCEGYLKFYSHVAPYMEFMKKEWLQQRPPANIMDAIRLGLI